jgi:hypothetical protein
MTTKRALLLSLTIGAAVSLGACSDSLLGGGPTTAALPEKPKVDPACVTLASQIDTLRKDGVAERLEQAAKGKGETVSVKRASLTKIAELNKANAEFQAKCGTVAPTTARTMPAPAVAPTTPAAATPKAVSSTPPHVAKTAAAVPAPVTPAAAKATAAPKEEAPPKSE